MDELTKPETLSERYWWLKENCDDVPNPNNYIYGMNDSAWAEAIFDCFMENYPNG